MDITELIENGMQGDGRALTALYGLYVGKVVEVCNVIVKDRMVAEEIANDAMLLAFKSLDKLREPRYFGKWVCVIGKNMALRYLAIHKKDCTVPLSEINLAIIDFEVEQDGCVISEEQILQAIESLPSGYCKVFKMSVIQGMSHKEIAGILNIAPHSSSSQLARAKNMLRQSLAKFLLAIVAVSIPVIWFLLKEDNDRPIQSPTVSSKGQDKNCDLIQKEQNSSTEPSNTYSERPSISIAAHVVECDNSGDTLRVAEKITKTDSVLAIRIPDTIKAALPNLELRLPQIGCLAHYAPQENKVHKSWFENIHLSFVGAPISGANLTSDYASVPDYATGGRLVKVHNWQEYGDYLRDNAQWMDTLDVANISNMINHSPSPSIAISETKRHYRPVTYQLSFSYPLANRWSLSLGLGYTRMKSVFESGDGNSSIIKTQKLHYISAPLGVSYRIAGNNRWQVYSSCGVGIDIPVKGSLTTKYLYTGPFDHTEPDSLMSPTTHATFKAPWQFNVGIGIGAQYQIVPHATLYFEPNIRYYFPTGKPIETYRTEHPFMFALPAGVRFTW